MRFEGQQKDHSGRGRAVVTTALRIAWLLVIALLGREAVVRRTGGGTGQVLLEGAWWTVRGRDAAVTEGQHVRVVDHDGLELIVEPAGPPQGSGTGQEDGP
ncbi:NfeD family protein [Streptomyces sp. Rer75]|uniref:NfeD family protein n=1 Tax=Streptomyces sp. Rer75 TaxID=2750011 RepID=UPI00211E10ED|nr:NfeD family protein [Streptomyces sp. Rer75]